MANKTTKKPTIKSQTPVTDARMKLWKAWDVAVKEYKSETKADQADVLGVISAYGYRKAFEWRFTELQQAWVDAMKHAGETMQIAILMRNTLINRTQEQLVKAGMKRTCKELVELPMCEITKSGNRLSVRKRK